jgi:uncharacterized membrane protein YedE/YeeE
MNFYAQDLLGTPEARVAALALGLLFGAWLERAGFGSSRKLTAIFYFRDFAVLQVLFTAVATASVAIFSLEGLGFVEPATWFAPATRPQPQLVGGALFGAGFVIGGFCPGTATVGLAAGRLDALAFLAGAGTGGVLLLGLPPVSRFLDRNPGLPSCSLAEAVGMPSLLLALGLLLAALAGGAALERLARRLSRTRP